MTGPKENSSEGKSDADGKDFAKKETPSLSPQSWEDLSAQAPRRNAGYQENRSGGALAILGLILGVLALGGLLFMGPLFKHQIDSVNTEMGRLSTTLSSVEKKMGELEHSVSGLHDQFGNLEKTMTILELRRMLQTMENISRNIPEIDFEKANQVQKSIQSLLIDLGSEVETPLPEDSLQQTEIMEEAPESPASEAPLLERAPEIPMETPSPALESIPEIPQAPEEHRTDISGHGHAEIPAVPLDKIKDFGKIELHQE